MLNMITIYYGASGTGKTCAVMDSITQKAAAGEKTLVIVPDQFTFEYERMLCERMGCKLFNNSTAEVLSLSRLTQRIFSECRDGIALSAADSTMKNALMYTALKNLRSSGQLTYYSRQANRPAFVRTALSITAELICSGITPEMLGNTLGSAPEGIKDKLTDIWSIYTEYFSLMEQKNLRDSMLDMYAAAECALRHGFFSDMCVYFDEFKSFTGDQYRMLEAVVSQSRSVAFALTTDNPSDSSVSPYRSVNSTASRLRRIAESCGVICEEKAFTEYRRFSSPELIHLAENLMRPQIRTYNERADSVTLVTAPDPYAQCDYICAELRRLVCETEMGLRFGDIAVLSRGMDDALSVLESSFKRYGIPFYSDKKPTAAHKPLMMFVSSAMQLACAEHISTEAMLRYLKTGLPGFSLDEITELENFCYKWDIDGELWESDFPLDFNEEQAAMKREFMRANELRKRAVEPVKALSNMLFSAPSGKDICAAVKRLVENTDIRLRLEKSTFALEKLSDGGDEEVSEQSAMLRENRRLLDDLDSIITSLERILGDEKVSPADFREMFCLAAEEITLAVPPQSLDAVSAQHLETARLSGVRAVFVMDASEGMLPCTDVKDSNFTGRETEFLENMGLSLFSDPLSRLAEERFAAFKAITCASELVYIVSPLTDFSGKPLYCASVVQRISVMLPQAVKIRTEELPLMFFCATEESAYAAAAACKKRTPEYYAVRYELEKNESYKKRFEYLDLIGKSGFGSQCRRIVRTSLIDRLCGGTLQISPSAFEDYSKCPFMYYCKNILRIYPAEKKELSAAEYGSIAHFVLCSVMKKYINGDTAGFIALPKETLEKDISAFTEEYIRKELAGSFAKKNSFAYFIDLLSRTLLNVLLNMQKEFSESDFIPVEFEAEVGIRSYKPGDKIPDGKTPVIIETNDAHSISFCGIVDRIDQFTDKNGRHIRVLDYKTGRKRLTIRQLVFGINMQMFMYLFVLTDRNTGKYKDAKPAGVLYYHIDMPEQLKMRTIEDDELLKHKSEALKMFGMISDDEDIIKAMEHSMEGKFVPVPDDNSCKKGDKGSVSMTGDFEKKLREYSLSMLKKLGENVFSGNIPALPLGDESVCTDPCKYCSYAEICNFGGEHECRTPDENEISAAEEFLIGGKESEA